MKLFLLTFLSITASLIGIQPQANADFSLEPMEPTNTRVFGGLRLQASPQRSSAADPRPNPRSLTEVECISTPQTGGGYCQRRDDATVMEESIFQRRLRDVFYTIGVSETVDANVRTRPSKTHPSEKNPSMILELGVDLE